MLRQLSSYAGIAAFACLAMAATAALAVDHSTSDRRPARMMAFDQAPGVDFMITGPVGRTGKTRERLETFKSDLDRPVRRRMHLN